MKQFLAILLALALVFALAACGKKPAPGVEETTAETTTETLTQEETSAFTLFPFPSAPTEATAAAGYAYEAYEAPIYYDPPPAAPQGTYQTPTADLNTAAITTFSGIATTTAAPGATDAPTTAALTTTAAPTTTQAPTLPPAQGTFSVSVGRAQAAGAPVTISVTTINQAGTSKARVYTGVKLKDFLAAQGVNLAAVGSGAVLTAKADDGETLTYSYSEIMSDKTLLAWDDAGEALSPPRLCPCATTDASRYLRGVITITLS